MPYYEARIVVGEDAGEEITQFVQKNNCILPLDADLSNMIPATRDNLLEQISNIEDFLTNGAEARRERGIARLAIRQVNGALWDAASHPDFRHVPSNAVDTLANSRLMKHIASYLGNPVTRDALGRRRRSRRRYSRRNRR